MPLTIYSTTGLGAWTSALKDKGFKRVLALEPVPSYNKWITVSAESDLTWIIY